MKGFFKFTFASILGVLIGLFIFILILFGIINSASRQKPVQIASNTVLYLELDQPIIDRKPENPFEYFNPATLEAESRLGLDMILNNLKKAAGDPNISGIVMDLTFIPAGMATLNEIRNALEEFKESGKFIYCFAENYTTGSYFLASVADKVYIHPQGIIPMVGLSADVLFIKGLLDKIGVESQVLRQGEFKGAIEPLIYKKLSEENRMQIQDYLNSMWGHITETIAGVRGISEEELNTAIDNLEIFDAKSALEYKLVDDLVYYDQYLDIVKELTGTSLNRDIKSVKLRKYDQVPELKEQKGLIRDKIAVVYATGTINMGEATEGNIGGDAFARAIREARKDSTIRAIVLRVNSGGGGGLPSDMIWREVKLAAAEKPVIASMGDVAASGGYYITAHANKILANPNTLTGSIGVFGVFPNMKELFNEKLGITVDVVKTNDHSDFGNPLRPLEAAEMRMLQEQIADFYQTFIEIVADGRGMSVEEVDKIARGHVYSGEDALNIGLIDEIGGLSDAIRIAAEDAGLQTYRIVKYPKVEDPFMKILTEITENASTRQLKKQLGEDYYYLESLKGLKDMKGIQARIPFDLRVE